MELENLNNKLDKLMFIACNLAGINMSDIDKQIEKYYADIEARKQQAIIDQHLSKEIINLEFNNRAYKFLVELLTEKFKNVHSENIYTIKYVCKLTYAEIKGIPGIGRLTRDHIFDVLSINNIHLS